MSRLTDQLDELGKKVDKTFKKYYILNGLSKSDEWKTDVTIVRTMDSDDSWSVEKLEVHLLSRENTMNLNNSTSTTTATSSDTVSSTSASRPADAAHYTYNHRGRGGRQQHANHDDDNESDVPRICRHFYHTGKCSFGTRCRFLHVSKQTPKAASSEHCNFAVVDDDDDLVF